MTSLSLLSHSFIHIYLVKLRLRELVPENANRLRPVFALNDLCRGEDEVHSQIMDLDQVRWDVHNLAIMDCSHHYGVGGHSAVSGRDGGGSVAIDDRGVCAHRCAVQLHISIGAHSI